MKDSQAMKEMKGIVAKSTFTFSPTSFLRDRRGIEKAC